MHQYNTNELNRRIDKLVEMVAEHDNLLDVIRDNSGNYRTLASGVRVPVEPYLKSGEDWRDRYRKGDVGPLPE